MAAPVDDVTALSQSGGQGRRSGGPPTPPKACCVPAACDRHALRGTMATVYHYTALWQSSELWYISTLPYDRISKAESNN